MHKSLAIAAFLTLLLGARAKADTILIANITNDQEVNVPPTTSAGVPRSSSGTAMFVLNDAHTAMTMTATVTGVDLTGAQSADTNDNLVAAHIHASSDP